MVDGGILVFWDDQIFEIPKDCENRWFLLKCALNRLELDWKVLGAPGMAVRFGLPSLCGTTRKRTATVYLILHNRKRADGFGIKWVPHQIQYLRM